MGLEVGAVALIALAVSATATTAQAVEARKQGKQQEKIQGQQRAVSKAQEIQQRRTAVRKARIARARIEQAGENTGTAGSSVESGAVGAISTNLSAQESGLRTSSSAATGIAKANKRIGQSQLRGTIFQGVGDIANTVFAATV